MCTQCLIISVPGSHLSSVCHRSTIGVWSLMILIAMEADEYVTQVLGVILLVSSLIIY